MKHFALLTVLLTLCLTTAAGATSWDAELHGIPPGETVTSTIGGNLKVYVRTPARAGHNQGTELVKTECALSGTGSFENTETEGLNELSPGFACSSSEKCGAVTITAGTFRGTLEDLAWPITDALEGELTVQCGATDYGTFVGTLEPTAGDADPQGWSEGKHVDDADSSLVFRTSGGQLVEPGSGDVVTIAATAPTGEHELGGNTLKWLEHEIVAECGPWSVEQVCSEVNF